MKNGTHAQPTNPFDVYRMVGIDGPQFNLAGTAIQAWLDGAQKMQAEATEFFNARAGKDMAALSELIHCSTPVEALEMQSRYASEVMSDFVAEGQRMIALLTGAAQRGVVAGK